MLETKAEIYGKTYMQLVFLLWCPSDSMDVTHQNSQPRIAGEYHVWEVITVISSETKKKNHSKLPEMETQDF